ncbi:MAG: dodecin domain-containing protein [Planctomycetes bacterium]|nr:dodecin domain-containing protein [Planctomycetota bacterium]
MAIARVTELTSSSPKGFEEAIQAGLTRAAKTVRGITGIEVVSLKAKVENSKLVEYRVDMKVRFLLEG